MWCTCSSFSREENQTRRGSEKKKKKTKRSVCPLAYEQRGVTIDALKISFWTIISIMWILFLSSFFSLDNFFLPLDGLYNFRLFQDKAGKLPGLWFFLCVKKGWCRQVILSLDSISFSHLLCIWIFLFSLLSPPGVPTFLSKGFQII